MNPGEILGFLLPQFNDTLQLTFFVIIVAMIIATIVSAHRMARPSSWEHKWNRGTPDDPTDDLDIEHGSVTDLWQAVATAPEKLAEIMPGMLLVVGLLGTFLGLGLALNHASSILGHANLADPGAAADSMQNLLGLLQGLGTKFKTSTWGIMGFVALKIWSEVTRFDEKRLAWVIGKVKAELELRKRTEAQVQHAREQALFTQIGATAQHIVNGFGEQLATLIKSNESLNLQQLAHLAKIEKSTDGVRIGLVQVETKIEQGTEGVRAELAQVQTKIEQGTEGVRTELAKVQTETQAMCSAMTTFTDSTQNVVEKMGTAAEGMASGADKVGIGATQLVQAVGTFEKQFTEVLDNVRHDLSAAINNLSAQASATLKDGSDQLKQATTQISKALETLSADVKTTMGSVETSINTALAIQERAAEEFILTSKTLNENIAVTTTNAEKLAKPIEDGLKAVSNASLRIRGIAQAVETSAPTLVKVVEQLQSLPGALEPLKNMPEAYKALLSTLKPVSEKVGVMAQEVETWAPTLDKMMEQLQTVPEALEPLKNMPEEHKALLAMLKPLSETVKVQQAMLELLEKMQRDRAYTQPVAMAAAEQVPDSNTAAA